jgi:hypothetical protein
MLTFNGVSDYKRPPSTGSAANSKYFIPAPMRVGNKGESASAIGYTSSLSVTLVVATSAREAGVPGMKLCLWTWYWEKSLKEIKVSEMKRKSILLTRHRRSCSGS